MRFRTHGKPTARELFRTAALTSLAALLFGGLFLWGSWAATGYDPEVGRDFRHLGTILVAACGLAVVMHYPWSPTWAAANGCKPDPEPSPAGDAPAPRPSRTPKSGRHP